MEDRKNIRFILRGIAVIFMILMLIANFYCFRGIKKYGLEAYFYQRMLVAYEVGQMRGLREELDRVLAGDKMPQELKLARGFGGDLGSIKEPQGYLKERLAERIRKVNLLQEVRNIAIILIFLLIIARILVRRFA